MTSKTRKAPNASATLFKVGTIKKGNDGYRWVIIADANGIQRWKKIPSSGKKQTLKRSNSERVFAMKADPETVWGKNKPLEKFWQELASGKKVVVIYTNGSHKIENVPDSKITMREAFDSYDAEPNIKAVLSSNMSQDAYELHLYPKAKDHTVNYVIQNYKKFFKSYGPMPADLIEKGMPAQHKVLYPA